MCYSNCYAQAGLSYCEQQQDGGGGENENGQINLQDAVYCTQLDVSEQAMEYYRYNQNMNNQYQNNNNMNNYNNYNAQAEQQQAEQQQAEQQDLAFFVGPHCHGGKVILGLFTDETCSIKAAEEAYENMFYGQHLPYSSNSIIESECMSCKVPSENDANINNQNDIDSDMYYYKDGQMYQQQQQQVYQEQEQEPDEVTEACGQLYAQSAKCEESLHVSGVYPDTRACNYIRTLKKEGGGALSSLRQNVNVTPSVLAGIFAATTVMFAGLSFHLSKKVKRSKVKLIH